MNWSAFGPYVLPFVIGCPMPVLEHHARLAAIVFCRRTLCWTQRLDPVLTDGTPYLDIESIFGAVIVKPKTVLVDGREWPLVSTQDGITLVSQEASGSFCFTEDGKKLSIYPIQPKGTSVVVRAAMAPSATTTTLHDDLSEYLQDIANGAIASIMRLPGQTFSNLDHVIHEEMFRDRIKTIAAKVSRGYLNTRIAGRARFF